MARIRAKTNGRVTFSTAADRLGVVLLGPPGSGKGTQGRMLSEALGIPRLSTGDLLRAEISAGTKLGRIVDGTIRAGGIVGDSLVNGLVARRLRRPDCAIGFILDGYPRSTEQAKFLQDLTAKLGFGEPIVLNFAVEVEVLMERLAARRHCPQCGRTYSNRSLLPLRAGYCDDDCVGLVRRGDDQETAIRERMANYRRLSGPLCDFFRHRRYYEIPAVGSPALVFDRAVRILSAENVSGRR